MQFVSSNAVAEPSRSWRSQVCVSYQKLMRAHGPDPDVDVKLLISAGSSCSRNHEN